MKNSQNSDSNNPYKLFEVLENDDEAVKNGKQMMITEMHELEESGILISNSTFADYELPDHVFDIKNGKTRQSTFNGGEAAIYKAVEKNEYSSKLDENGRYTGTEFKALREKQFSLIESNNVLREIQAMSKIKHENVVRIEKVFFEHCHGHKYRLYVVMPWIDDTLLSWIMRKQNDSRLDLSDIKYYKIQRSFAEIRNVLTEILMGISSIHACKMIHMDLNFINIMVETYKENENFNRPKIIDFGFAKHLNRLTSTTGGTDDFMAPEILTLMRGATLFLLREDKKETKQLKEQFFTPKADIYSFGVILYKIFIHETEIIDIKKINQKQIKQRISQIFSNEGENTILETLIEDIEDILVISLAEIALNRPNAADLLLNHPFFNQNISKCPNDKSKILFISFENLEIEPSFYDDEFKIGLNCLDGGNGFDINLEKARQVFQRIISSEFEWTAAAKLVVEWMAHEDAFASKLKKYKALENMNSLWKKAYAYFGYLEGDQNGFLSYFLAFAYFHGIGGIKKDFTQARLLFTKSSEKSNLYAFKMLRLIYTTNAYGDQQDEDMADECYENYKTIWEKNQESKFQCPEYSANERFCRRICNIAQNYDNGLGVPKDIEKAKKYYEIAADLENYAPAQKRLADHLIKSGDGMDLLMAKEYLKKAASQGDEGAAEQLQELGEYI